MEQLPSIDDFSTHFHVSVAWSLLGPSEEVRSALGASGEEGRQDMEIAVSTIKVKVGNTVSAIPLHLSQGAKNGIMDD